MFRFAWNSHDNELNAFADGLKIRFMVSSTRRVIFTRALCCGIFLLAGMALSAGQETPSVRDDAPGAVIPNSSQGSVDGSGKFVPATSPGENSKPPTTSEEWKNSASKLIEKTGDHTFRVGIVQCDRVARTLTIPARVNAREGLIEYALVTRQGKVHEALLSTEAQPLHVQMAALLLGISPQPGTGQSYEVMIEVEWASNGPKRKVALEDLMTLAKGSPRDVSGATMARGPWKFTGSQIDLNGFAATREGSVIALIEDPAALIENPRPGREDDSLHVPNAAAMPGTGAPVSVCIRLKTSDALDSETPAKP